jgi:aminoglycoside/choline kinase family phosphotransferase
LAENRIPAGRLAYRLAALANVSYARDVIMEILRQLFARHFGSEPESTTALQGELGGSGRRILRLRSASASAIGVLHDGREENVAFLSFSRHFRALGLPVPEIYAEDLARGAYLQQDLGDTTLYQFLQANRDGKALSPTAISAYRKVVEMLPRFQVLGGQALDYSVCYPRAAFDRQSMAWDLNYFKYYFLRLAGIAFSEQALENDFEQLTKFLLQAPSNFFLYRDFQSRNVMLVNGGPYFVDYQGGRRGALQYDIASLLFDAKADLPPAMRESLLEHYLNALAGLHSFDRGEFLRYYPAFVLVRILQALGAYGYRGYFERKPHFLRSIPFAIANLKWLLGNAELPLALPALGEALRAMIASEKLQAIAASPDARDNGESGVIASSADAPLTVRIMSFSFHRGLPRDTTGNGGGFVFDARALPNPGRQHGFMALCGKDQPVIQYLESQPEVSEFFTHALSLTEMSIASYKKRGFSSLMVSFGCTGGQHRSVYLAERLASALRGRDGVQVVLEHRELDRMERERLAQ